MTPHKELDIGGESFAYIEAGTPGGPLVLCVHGFPDHPGAFSRLMADLAAAGFWCVAPWLRGYAPSTLRPPYDMAKISEDLEKIASTLSPDERAVIVGHDWGAVATYQVLARWPERFGRAVTLSAPHPVAFARNAMRVENQLRRSWYMFFFQISLIAERAVAKDDFAFVDRLYRRWSPGYDPDPEHMTELKACLARSMPAPIEYYRAALRPTRARLRSFNELARMQIATPTLYLHGARDGCIGYGVARGQERFFKAELRSELLSGVGHFLLLEDPKRVNARILEWLRA